MTSSKTMPLCKPLKSLSLFLSLCLLQSLSDFPFSIHLQDLCRTYPELEEPPNCLLQFLFKTTASIHVTSKSDKEKERSGSGGGVFGTLKRKKKTREKMRDIKTKAEKDQEKSKDSLLEEKPVEKLNPLFLVGSQSVSGGGGEEKKISNPLLSVVG